MNVLMIGWEYPPFSIGGLGTHCYWLTRYLADLVDLYFLMPHVGRIKPSNSKMKIIQLPNDWYPFYQAGRSLFDAVNYYNKLVVDQSRHLDFDLVHVHDWIGINAGVRIKEESLKPLIITFHSTEYDRTAGHPWGWIKDIERRGVENADMIITVSNLMKRELIKIYNADSDKIRVIYNGIDPTEIKPSNKKGLFGKKIVLYLGRLSVQKNVDSFLRAAALVLKKRKDVHFVVSGKGPTLPHLLELVVDLGISKDVTFTGYVNDDERDWLYSIADLYVLPSVSEPFGITVLEAVAHGTPVIVSKTVGASEVLKDTLKVDFWDIEKMASYILASLDYKVLYKELREKGLEELRDITWEEVARRTYNTYKEVLGWT